MTKVYVVIEGLYSDRSVEAVFANLESAEAYVIEHSDDICGCDYFIEEFDIAESRSTKGKKATKCG